MSDKTSEDLSYSFATIDQIYEDGITLIFDGEETASEKHYKCNSFCVFAAGQRVRVIKDSGTYVVEYPVGNPNADAILPAGGTDGQVLTKDGNEGIASKWADMRGIPTGGTKGQLLSKRTNEAYDVEWTSPKNYIPSGGSNGQMLVKNGSTAYALKWADAPENYIPSGGNDGQALLKSGTTPYALKWGSPTVARLYQGSSNYVDLNSSRALVPHASSRTYPYSLGSSSVPWYALYTGDGTSRICGTRGTLGFFGASGATKQTLSLSSNNMSYTSVTANNYLYALNNLIGILKNKYGLIA